MWVSQTALALSCEGVLHGSLFDLIVMEPKTTHDLPLAGHGSTLCSYLALHLWVEGKGGHSHVITIRQEALALDPNSSMWYEIQESVHIQMTCIDAVHSLCYSILTKQFTPTLLILLVGSAGSILHSTASSLSQGKLGGKPNSSISCLSLSAHA